MRLFLILLACMISSSVYAELDLSYVNIYHPKKESSYKQENGTYRKYNKSTFMISYQKDNLAISYFKNSHFNDTFFIGYINNYEIITDLKIGLSAGVSYGYSLGKILKKESFLRKKLYDKYDKWDKPILPLAYMYIEYRIIKKNNIGIGITPNLAFTTYYKLKY